jgi:hypothetical protein
MPTKISRNQKFIERQLKLGNKLATAKPSKKPTVVRPRSESDESLEVVNTNIKNFDYMSMLVDIKRRVNETDDVLVAIQAVDFLEGLDLIDQRDADLLADYVEKAFETPSIELDQLNFTIDKLESSKFNTEMLSIIVAQLKVVAENLQNRLDGIVQGSYTACDALADAATGAALGVSVMGPVGGAGGTILGTIAGGPAGATVLGSLGAAAGSIGGAVGGGFIGMVLGWAARTATDVSEKREEQEDEDSTNGTASAPSESDLFLPEECFPRPVYFHNIMTQI